MHALSLWLALALPCHGADEAALARSDALHQQSEELYNDARYADAEAKSRESLAILQEQGGGDSRGRSDDGLVGVQ